MYITSWSGGKDSCFACYKAWQAGYKIASLVNFISREYKRVCFHGTDSKLVQIQSELAGIPLYQKETTPDNYENEFKDAVKSLGHYGIEGMIFGDIYLDEHKRWVERVCNELNIIAIEPLWERNTEELMQDFIRSGFRAVVVSGQVKFIDKEWIGRWVDENFMEYLKTKPDVDICGERGEYHTFVLGGPLFKGSIKITEKEVINRNGYWFLDIKDYKVLYG
ncbi:MAG: diphthine--ammonia ligase [Thermodesulfovibrionales bacterium]|nr:diphthine--ammonia ligase [Thermodesulfovibrionales bacterium]